MDKDKQMILAEISESQEQNELLQNKKSELEKEILGIDIHLNTLMIKYDKLCKKLLTNTP